MIVKKQMMKKVRKYFRPVKSQGKQNAYLTAYIRARILYKCTFFISESMPDTGNLTAFGHTFSTDLAQNQLKSEIDPM